MFVQIRGSSGSGKTYLVRNFMNWNHGFEPVKDGRKTWGYTNEELNVHVVGSYESACGGTDTIKTQDEICNEIRKWTKDGYNVIAEGLIMSHIYQRYLDLAIEIGLDDCWYICLDTSLYMCFRRVFRRRFEKGNYNRVQRKLIERLVHEHARNIRLHYTYLDAGVKSLLMNSDEAYEWVDNQLGK